MREDLLDVHNLILFARECQDLSESICTMAVRSDCDSKHEASDWPPGGRTWTRLITWKSASIQLLEELPESNVHSA